MKIIGIDGNEANIFNRVGVNVFAFEIIHNLSLLQDIWKDYFSIIVYLKDKPLSDLPKPTEKFQYKILPKNKGPWIITKLFPRLLINPEKLDLFFTPSHYTPPFTKIPKICSIMDLGYLENSGHFKKLTYWQLKYWSAISILTSKYIISISEATKKEIVRQYPYTAKKIYVVPLAYNKTKYKLDININDVRHVKKKYSIVDDYILFIGTLKPSKNIDGIIKAFALLCREKQYDSVKLVIAGKKGWMFKKIFELVGEMNLKNKVIFTDFVSEKDKTALISGAKVLISPSFTEGFGLHILEAMACGTPTVISNAGSLPEVAGKAGIYVQPGDVGSIALGLKNVLSMTESEYNKLVRLGLTQVQKYSWRKSTIRILDIFKK